MSDKDILIECICFLVGLRLAYMKGVSSGLDQATKMIKEME